MLLEIEVTFAADRYHGDEWPPSPARLFQALVAASHHGAHGWMHQAPRDSALHWLERQPPPAILAPFASKRSNDHLINYVPNNDNKFSNEDHVRTDKSLAVRMISPDVSLVYAWAVDNELEACRHADIIGAMASLVTWLGQTSDKVLAQGRLVAEPSHRPDARRQFWSPHEQRGGAWLSPAPGFLQLLQERFPLSVSTRPPDFTNSRQVDYHAGNRNGAISSPIPWDAFFLRRSDGRPLTLDPTRLREISGMVRHAMIAWSQQPVIRHYYEPDLLARYIHGHSATGEPSKGGHIAVVPLPSLDPPFYKADGRIRRVILVGYGAESGKARELFGDVIRGLHGQSLLDKGRLVGELQLLTHLEQKRHPLLFKPLTENSRCWRSVTPIILSSLMRRGRTLEKCLLRVVKEAGIPEDWIESTVGFTGPVVPTSARANQYRVNEAYLSTSIRCHAEIVFRQPITGPLVLGRGKFVGFGLMVPWGS